LPYEGHLFAGGIAHPKIQGRKSKQKTGNDSMSSSRKSDIDTFKSGHSKSFKCFFVQTPLTFYLHVAGKNQPRL